MADVADLDEANEGVRVDRDNSTRGSEMSVWAGDPEAAIAQFTREYFRELPGSEAQSARVYEADEAWANEYGISPGSKNWFTRRLEKQLDLERTTEYRGGATNRYYPGSEFKILDGSEI